MNNIDKLIDDRNQREWRRYILLKLNSIDDTQKSHIGILAGLKVKVGLGAAICGALGGMILKLITGG